MSNLSTLRVAGYNGVELTPRRRQLNTPIDLTTGQQASLSGRLQLIQETLDLQKQGKGRSARKMYSDEMTDKLEREASTLEHRMNELMQQVVAFGDKLKNNQAKEFMLQGVGRRVNIINRAHQNIFRLFPLNQETLLSQEDRTDVEINVHTFLINVYGIIENLALCVAYEHDLYGGQSGNKLARHELGLFRAKFIGFLGAKLREYLSEERLRLWFDDYSKNFRDALAHRIPPYIPPSGLTQKEVDRFNEIQDRLQQLNFATDYAEYARLQDEQLGLGHPFPIFVHSISEKSRQVKLHPQIIVDLLTVEEIVTFVLENFEVVRGDKEAG